MWEMTQRCLPSKRILPFSFDSSIIDGIDVTKAPDPSGCTRNEDQEASGPGQENGSPKNPFQKSLSKKEQVEKVYRNSVENGPDVPGRVLSEDGKTSGKRPKKRKTKKTKHSKKRNVAV